MLNAPLRILIVAALCVAALIGLVVREGMARASGQEVMLPMAAVDPRALLQGHYVIVSLQENLPVEAPCPATLDEQQFWSPSGQVRELWLALAPNGAHHSVVGASAERAAAAQLGPVVVRGSASCFKPTTVEYEPQQPGVVQAHIGIERFHINQTEAERIQGVMQSQQPGAEARVFAIVTIGADGRARLNGLMVDGERLMLNWY